VLERDARVRHLPPLGADGCGRRALTIATPTAMPASATPRPQSARFVPALEGVRGVAQAMIMAFHYFPIARSYALKDVVGFYFASFWAGVDLFFALSGFLITGILLDHPPGGAVLRSFYARRVLRIFPLYWSFLLFFLVVLPLVLGAVDFTGPYPHMPNLVRVAQDQHWFWLYLSNFWEVAHGFPGNGLGIVWSLAIEEQFYLVWPMVVLLCSSARRLGPVCVVIALGSMLIRARVAGAGEMRAAYFVTACHMDGLALGALGAVLVRSRFRDGVARAARWVVVGLSVLVAAHVWTTPLLLFSVASFAYWLPVLNVLFAALVVTLATSSEERPLARFFGSAPLTWAGRHSYALYLLHLPAYQWVEAYVAPRIGDGPWLVAAVATLVSVVLSIATYHLIEQPFLALKRYVPYEK
jgi:peptidoglycan/LPS O-acetylase OafA/YrhL